MREHEWDVTKAEARAIQERLGGRREGQERLGKLRTVAGLGAAFPVRRLFRRGRAELGLRLSILSQGNRVSLATALKLVSPLACRYRMPRPTRDTDRFTREIKKKLGLGAEK